MSFAILENILYFIKTKRLYFIILACVVVLAAFWAYRYNDSSAKKLMEEADYTAKHGQIAYAIEDYIKIVRNFPENYEAHLRLAELYLKVNEIDMAKVEYVKAMKLGYRYKYHAQVALADLYAKEDNYSFAEGFIDDIKDIKIKEAQELIGDFYYNWGLSFQKTDKAETIRKFKVAFEHYKNTDSPKKQQTQENIKNLYMILTNNLLEGKKYKDALELLSRSLEFWDNAETHYKKAKIYESLDKIDESLKEYQAAFKLDPEVDNTVSYVQLLIKKAEIEKKKGDKVSSELYYTLAKKVNSETTIPSNPQSSVILNIVSARCNENMDKDILVPEIIFRLRNVSKDKLSNVKVKTVFLENNSPFSEEINVLASAEKSINSDELTDEIVVFSSKPVNHVFDNHNLSAHIYISQGDTDKWTLFRKVRILVEKESDIPIIEVK